MISINFVTEIDVRVTVGIIVRDDIKSDIIDVFTMPSTGTFWTSESLSTFNMFTMTSTVVISPFIFNLNHTDLDFTDVNLSVVVGITIIDKEV